MAVSLKDGEMGFVLCENHIESPTLLACMMDEVMTKHILQWWAWALSAGILAACSPSYHAPAVAVAPAGVVMPAGTPHPMGYRHQALGSPAAYKVVAHSALPQWETQNFGSALGAFRQSCTRLRSQAAWQNVCAQADALASGSPVAARQFFERYFTAWEVSQNGQLGGTVTGYYEPVLQGSRLPTAQARFPIYGVPNDMITVPLNGRRSGVLRVAANGQITPNGQYTIDLSKFMIQANSRVVKARASGSQLVPYYTRDQINGGALNGRAPILAYANDPVELFFMHIQGSGRIQTPDGGFIRLGFADKNEYPYASIGRYMANQGYLPLAQTSMQGIKAWMTRNPHRLAEVLGKNPSYVFFRELPNTGDGPLGALGVPLTSGYSAAVDRRYMTLGAPFFLATSHPDNGWALNRLMVAQDTGSAIQGAVRVDFFWGYGDEAGRIAGRMKQTGYVWQLLPNGMLPGGH